MHPRKLATTCGFVAVLTLACSSTSMVPAESPGEPAMTPAAGKRSEQVRAGPQGDVEVITLTGIGVEPSLAEVCDIALPEAFFEFDATQPEPPAPTTLDAVATCLKTGPLRGKRVRLVGHADPRGTDAYNKKLGRSRAESVAKYLEEHGVARDRILVETHGAEHALDIPKAYAFDRRVDIERADAAY
jgi:peptidoglycan-associated lipoprotein